MKKVAEKMNGVLGMKMKKMNMMAIAGLLGASVYAEIIDFNSLAHNDAINTLVGSQYIEGEYQFDALGGTEFHTMGMQGNQYTGSTALHMDDAFGVIQMSKVGGGTFDLISIDLAEYFNYSSSDVTFTRDGGHSQTFTTTESAGGYTPETFIFDSGFKEVTTVTWVQEPSYHQFDNVNVIPEPATLAFVGIFGGGLWFIRRFFPAV